MNTEEKTAWIDEKNKIVSFHAIDDGKMIIKAESLFWDFLFGLTSSGYRVMCGRNRESPWRRDSNLKIGRQHLYGSHGTPLYI